MLNTKWLFMLNAKRFALLLILITAALSGADITQPPFPGVTSNGAGGLNVTGTLQVGTTVLDPLLGASDPTASLLPKWRLALANVLTGTGDAKILFIGDSTTAGLFGDGSDAASAAYRAYPARLVALLNARGIPAAMGLAVPAAVGQTDNRWAGGTGWTQAGSFGFGLTDWTANAPAGALVFTPGAAAGSYDSFDVYYMSAPGRGTLTMTATGGTPVVVNLAVAGNGILHSTVVAASAGTSNAVTMTSTGGLSEIVGVEPFLSTAKKVRVGNAGSGGRTTNQWALPTGAYYGTAAIAAYAPNLSITSLGINDAGASVVAATVSANMQTIITAEKISGDAVILTMPPSSALSGAQYPAFEATYQPIFKALSVSNNIPIVDYWTRLGGVYQAAFMSGVLHPNAAGYFDMASAVDALLRRAQ